MTTAHADLITPLDSWCRREPDAIAVICEGETLTRQQLQDRSRRVAVRLGAEGIAPGDRVALMGTSSLNMAIALVGIFRAGAVLVPMSERLSISESTAIARRAQPAAVIVDEAHHEVIATTESWKRLILEDVVDTDVEGSIAQFDPYGDRIALIAFTSGSTGLPKGAIFTHSSLLTALFEWVLNEPALLRGRSLNVSSFAYFGGFLNGTLAPLIFGGSAVLLPKWDPGVALKLIEQERPTSLASTSIFYEQMAEHPDFASTDLSSIVVAIAGGSPVPRSLLDTWHGRGVSVRQGYGLTEGGSQLSLASDEQSLTDPETAGVGGVLREVRAMLPDGSLAAEGEPGELVARGPGMALGYWQDPEATEAEMGDGWLHTGDIGTVDARGGIRVVGRKKDVIISGGINIYAAELERVIGGLDGVVEVAVIGVPDEKFGETPAALVRLADGEADASGVFEHCRQNLASYKVPRYVHFLGEALERTTLGKLDKPTIRTQYVDIVLEQGIRR